MPRMDIRIKTRLSGRAVYFSGKRRVEEAVVVNELSLSSAMVSGMGPISEEGCTLNINLPPHTRVELPAHPLRSSHKSTVFRLYFPEKQAYDAIWSFLRKQTPVNGSCPYCGGELQNDRTLCGACRTPLDVMDSGYLERHLHATFLARLESRLSRCDGGLLLRLLTTVDQSIIGASPGCGNDEFVGTAPALREVFATIRKAACTDMNILILGESGTGKELTAQAIHERSQRRDQLMVVVNCAAIPEQLLESELFGYEKGAFTGAYARKAGRFELADRGTIFLDEIGELPAPLQAKLLRFLEDHTVERVGGKRGTHVDVRIIAATNCNLAAMVDQGTFRRDLYYRLNTISITLPPLRERGDDIILLAKYFFQRFGAMEQSGLQGFSPAALAAISAYDWPGNVRELINKVRRALVMASGKAIEPEDLELARVAPFVRNKQPYALADSREQIIDVLEQTGYCVTRAARVLGVSRPTLYASMRRHGIDPNGPHTDPGVPHTDPGVPHTDPPHTEPGSSHNAAPIPFSLS
ncbi:sigma-54 interaction domain-containing protein [Geomonas azotofigens]|uniref:sigma-54 interaction domain-containing protein n=1 Tax=Geomonas azotofigens TaxID=2843196 RepID=UPI001C1153A5|nr:sigma 54-interacting transcriptional regulator [Geomonas azotofigens]MBU5612464.1 sigma 54-interacting transcriptional regulator [Geomonas azotofigens]